VFIKIKLLCKFSLVNIHHNGKKYILPNGLISLNQVQKTTSSVWSDSPFIVIALSCSRKQKRSEVKSAFGEWKDATKTTVIAKQFPGQVIRIQIWIILESRLLLYHRVPEIIQILTRFCRGFIGSPLPGMGQSTGDRCYMPHIERLE